jgi:hypothetical protein
MSPAILILFNLMRGVGMARELRRSALRRLGRPLSCCSVVGLWVCLFAPEATYAKRSPEYFQGGTLAAWPSVETALPTNGRIVLMGDRQGSRLLREVTAVALRLVAEEDVVPVRVVWRSQGERYAQALLVPERRLQPGQVYTLQRGLTGRDGDYQPLRLVTFRPRGMPEETAARWRVGATADHEAPRWREPPAVDAPVCGTARHGDGCSFDVRVAVEDGQGDVRVRVDIPRKNASPLRFYLPIRQGRLGWVLGADVSMYRPHTLGRHRLTMTAVDLAGNTAPDGGTEVVVPAARLRTH